MRIDRRTAALAAAIASAPAFALPDAWDRLERIDVQPNGAPTATRFAVDSPGISDDGRWVVFSSTASDLVAGDTNGKSDIFVRDRRTNVTRRLSLRSGGAQTSADSIAPAISPDARFVTFVSGDSQLVAGDTNSVNDAFLIDRDADANGVFDEPGGTTIERVSLNNAGAGFFNGVRNVTGAVDERGRSPVFVTLQSLVADDTNGTVDVYARDRAAGASRALSRSGSDAIGNDDSPDFFNPPLRMSDDGAVVAFSSEASNLVTGDTNGSTDIFVRRRDSDGNGVFDEAGGSATLRANASAGGTSLPIGGFAQFDLSGDGRWLAFSRIDTAGTNPSGADIALRDLAGDAIVPVAFVAGQWTKGTQSCCGNQAPLVARRAAVVAFSSTQLYAFGAGVTGGRSDVFVKSRRRDLTRLTDYPVPAAVGDGYGYGAKALSRGGGYLVVAIAGAGAAAVPQEGVFVYRRDTIFDDGVEP